MIEESLYKTSFIGRDGFRWWIGQIPPIKSHKEQPNGQGWGNRLKVRILGYHPYSEAELSNDDLPWAQILLSPTAGSGASNYATNPKIRPGDTVFGFFLDGDNGQLPVIIGCFGRTDQVPSKQFSSPFVPYTGYTPKVEKPSKTLYPSESNENKKNSQKSPRDLPPSSVNGVDELYYFSGVGKKIVFGNSATDTLSQGIGAEIGNLLQKVNDVTNKILNVTAEISRSVDKIVGIADGFVSQAIDSLYRKLIPLFQQGLDLLYKQVYAAVFAATQNAAIAHAAGVAAQTAMVGPVKLVQSYIPKLFGTVVNSLFDMVTGMVTDVVKNSKKFRSCVEEQFTGSLLNGIISKIESGISGPLAGVSKILSAAFSVGNFLRSGVSALRSVNGLFNSFQHKNKSVGGALLWVINQGNSDGGYDKSKFENILSSMNAVSAVKNAASDVANSASDVVNNVTQGWDIFSPNTKNKNSKKSRAKCYTGPKDSCSGPKVKIFGGSGRGAEAEVIMGSFDKKSSKTTGSIIGIKLKKKGKRYKYPPFVEIVDDCEQGYGAVARAIINEDGEVTSIYVVSEGENYPVGNSNINILEPIANTDPAELPSYVSEVVIVDPGYGYDSGDIVFDDAGNFYDIIVDSDGSIIDVNITIPQIENNSNLPDEIWRNQITENGIPLSELEITEPNRIQSSSLNKYIRVDNLPTITIESQTGSGAVLKAILEKIPLQEIQQQESFVRGTKYVKDCIE